MDCSHRIGKQKNKTKVVKRTAIWLSVLAYMQMLYYMLLAGIFPLTVGNNFGCRLRIRVLAIEENVSTKSRQNIFC